MSEKKCLACRSILTGAADCPVCGNPDYIVPDMKPEQFKKMQGWADTHRKNLLNDITISVYAYAHEVKDDKLVQKSVKTVKVCDASELSFDDITWLDQAFAQIDTDEKLELTVIVQKSGQEFKKQNISFYAPALDDFWHIGAYLTAGLGVSFVIGNEVNSVKTESISLL